MSNIYEFIFYFLGGPVTGGYIGLPFKTNRGHTREIMLHTRIFFFLPYIFKKILTGLLTVNHCNLQQMKKYYKKNLCMQSVF